MKIGTAKVPLVKNQFHDRNEIGGSYLFLQSLELHAKLKY